MSDRKWVRILATSFDDIAAIRKSSKAEILRSTLRRVDSNHLLVEAYVPDEQIRKLQSAHSVCVLGDVETLVREAAKCVSWDAPYLSVDAIETALADAAAAHPAVCQLVTLPNVTHEGRTSHAVLLRAGALADRPGVLLLGGAHAREWGSSDILVSLVQKLITAYEAHTGVTFQGKTYSAAEVQRILETLDLFVFPDMNPDGKAYSQSGHDWRKNRRPIGATIGVDVNRNYDFMWDTNVYFDPTLDFSYLWDPSSWTYHGPSPFSEAESSNVRWLLDTYPQIAWFVDLHSAGQKIMIVWGDDENQNEETAERFSNPAFNGQRGKAADVYGEFIFADDDQKQVRAADRMRDAIFAVRGKSYTVGQIFDQVGVSAGDSAPYVFSRHIADSSRRKVISFGVEWGTTFQPAVSEMTNIIDDIGAALTELCLCAAEPDLYIRDHLGDAGKEPSTGSLSASPDIIVRKDPVADPAAAFGDAAVDPGSDKVEIGNDNYVYVRVHNRGGQAAEATVRVYWAPLTTTCAPAAWTFLDEIAGVAAPAGGMAVAGPVLWPHVADPGTAGHFCLIALCGNALDPVPDPALIDSAADFVAWMRNGNNQAYRNVVFEDARLDGWVKVPFLLHGFGKRGETFELEIDAKGLPRGAEVEIKALPNLKARELKPLARNSRGTHFALGGAQAGAIEKVRIPKGRAPQMTVFVRLPEAAERGKRYALAVIQKWNGRELGRFTLHARRR